MPLMRRNITIRRSRAAGWARIAGGLAVPVLVLGAGGVRAGLVPEIALQPVLVVGFALALAGLCLALYALVDIWNSGAEGAGTAVAGIVYASPVLAVLAAVVAAAFLYPRLADVSTDVNDPPAFTASAAAHRGPDPDSLARQAEAYPELQPKLYPLPLGDVFVAARQIVGENGWTVTRETRPEQLPMASSRIGGPAPAPEDPELTQALAAKSVMTQSRGGRAPVEPAPALEAEDMAPAEPAAPRDVATIEAEAPTPVFGFRDDVVLRLRIAEDGGTQVDMRSASRVGAHDLGQNARRIRGFFAKLDAVLQPKPGDTASR